MTMLNVRDEGVIEDPDHPGQWRLTRIELVNWGTFAGHATVEIARKGHLFTGASGSGKSSLLDAIAAVLTPDRWLRLNAAAQEGTARQGDRTLMSYVRGAWSKEADTNADRAVTSFLRGKATWSGVLLRYENLNDRPLSLARVFHAPGTRTDTASLKDARLVVQGEFELMTLKPHVESGIDARKMTAALPDALITTGGKHGRFHERVVRLFGFRGDTTLQLLHKTQSAKNLGTLDALFRGFMLDHPGTFARAENAVEQFTELDRAHAHVVDLRRQADALRRVDTAITTFDAASAQETAAAGLHDAVDAYTAMLTLQIARAELAPARAELARADARLRDAEREHQLAMSALESARARVRNEGGARVELLGAQIATAEAEERGVAHERARLAVELERLGAPMPAGAAEFTELLATAMAEAARDITAVPHALYDARSEARKAHEETNRLITTVRNSRTNLPPRLLAARAFLAQRLHVPEAAIPFAAELLSVVPAHAAWRGAIERVLAPLATTLLVRDEHLATARRAADSRHLGVRLVIEAVPPVAEAARRPRDARSLVHRVTIADGVFTSFLRTRLAADYDYTCVDDPDELDRIDRGVTIAGLVKRSSRRYEKDDRSEVGDATRWMLGGDVHDRTEALLDRLRIQEAALATANNAVEIAEAERTAAVDRRSVFSRVAEFTWDRIDTASAQAAVDARRAELATLTAASQTLRDAQAALELATNRMTDTDDERGTARGTHAVAVSRVRTVEQRIEEQESAPGEPIASEFRTELETRFRAERRSLSLETVDAVARKVQATLSREKDAAGKRVQSAAETFAGGAAAFAAAWPAASADLTIEIGDRYGYRDLLEGIVARGLPQKEGEFLALLRERSRDLIAHLLGDLRDAPALVRERILPVNASLGRSPFEGDDLFLEIEVKTARTGEVEQFLADLRRIVEGNWSDESLTAAEERFGVLQRVINRLGSKDRVDQDWKTRVLDTRLHVTFLAREKSVTGRVARVYDSSEGLSGGQRQKLVVFCLAAALRYQLTEEEDEVPRFGTVVLDEAFSNADSAYTRSAMDVFDAFGFHMVLATPQKLLQTLEPYVGAITSVSNPARNASRIANVVFDTASAHVPVVVPASPARAAE